MSSNIGLVVNPKSGFVGIGTGRPSTLLHVDGNMLAAGTITASNLSILGDFVTLNTITSNTEQMVIQNAGTGPALKVTQTGAHPIADFYDDGQVLAMRIADGGNVGIGTIYPQSKLHVVGNTIIASQSIVGQASVTLSPPSLTVVAGTTATARFAPIDGAQGRVSTIQLWSTFQNTADNGSRYTSRITSGFNLGAWGNEYLAIGVGNNAAANDGASDPIEKLRVLSNGNVGIGTENPQEKLHVYGNITITAPNDTPILRFERPGASFDWEIYAISGGTLRFRGGGDGIKDQLLDRVTFTADGKVGVGTTNPVASLHVNGSFYSPGMIVQTQFYQNTPSSQNGYIGLTTAMNRYATGLSVSITPKFANSKMSITLNTGMTQTQGGNNFQVFLYKNGSEIVVAQNSWGWSYINMGTSLYLPLHMRYFDTPSTTSLLTYDIRLSGIGYLVHVGSLVSLVVEEIAQ